MSEPQAAMDRNQLTDCEGQRLRAGSRTRRWTGRGTLLFLFGFLLIAAIPLEAQHRITGRVTAAVTGEPLAGVQVQVRGTAAGALSNASGLFQVPVYPEWQRLVGFGSRTLSAVSD
jgi:hypothetical protein